MKVKILLTMAVILACIMPAMAVESDFPFDYYHYNTCAAPGINDTEYIYASDYGFGWGSGLYADDYLTLNSSVDGWVTVQIIGSTGFNGEIQLYNNVSYNTGDDMWIHNESMWAGPESIGISNITQLQFIDNFVTYDYHLLNDINASETITWNGGDGFDPIGTTVLYPFSGTFDLMGYTISDITIDRQTEDRAAMFEKVTGTVKNGTISGAYVQGDAWAAVVAGSLQGTIENIRTLDGVVIGYGLFTGGIAGQASGNNANLYRCYNINTVGSGSSYVGGIVGSMSDGTIEQCINAGDITTTSTFVGGISGAIANGAIIQDSYSTGYVTATSDYAGGITAYAADSSIINSYTTGPVNSGTFHGGAVGTQSESTATSVYWDMSTSGRTTSALGTGKTTSEMFAKSTYSGWDFTNSWEMFGNYPVLQFVGTDGYSVDPYIISPANGTVTNTTYPPLETAISFSWAVHDNADSSSYTIARDSNFNTVVASGTITSFSRSVNLPGGDYWFRVKYNFDDSSSSDYSISEFSINSTGVDFGTAVQGVVYQSLSGSQTPLSGALVRIYNDTWSNNYVTSSNGYYLFNSELTNSTYYIIGTKDGYTDSTLNIVTLQDNVTTTKNIVMERETAPTYIYPHYVLFTVKSVFGGVYPDVTVNVYEGDSATAIYTGITGDDGAVGFELSETISYRLTLYSDEHDIDTTYRVTPTKDSYNIYVSLYSTEPTQQDDGVILYGIHTDGNDLNVTWNDTSGLTTNVYLWINNTDGTNAYYLTSTDSDSSLTQEVNTTANLTYVVKLKIESAGLENDFIRTHVVNFEEGVKTAFDLGFTESWQSMFLAALSIIFIAVLFGSANAHVGAVMVSFAGLFHVFVTGWIPANPLTVVMLFIAVIVAGLFYMRKGEAVR